MSWNVPMPQMRRPRRIPCGDHVLMIILGIGLAAVASVCARADEHQPAAGEATDARSIVAPDAIPAEAIEPPPRPDAANAAGVRRRSGSPWAHRVARMARPVATDGWWLGMAGIALALAVCGAICAGARRFLPRGTAGAVQVVGRVSLSPKHTVYLLRVGRRVLLVGAGPQAAPSLISELDDFPEPEPEPDDRRGDEP
jgi:flagellar biogenesis protein FliO